MASILNSVFFVSYERKRSASRCIEPLRHCIFSVFCFYITEIPLITSTIHHFKKEAQGLHICLRTLNISGSDESEPCTNIFLRVTTQRLLGGFAEHLRGSLF